MRILNNEDLKKIIADLRIKRNNSKNLISIDLESSIIKDLIVEKGGYICTTDSNVFFQNSIFIESDLINTPFACYNWKFDNCTFIKCNLSKLFMPEGIVKGCNFLECNFSEMNMDGTFIEQTLFISCNFSASSFNESVIRDSKFLYSYSLLKQEVFKDAVEENVIWIP